MDINTVIFDFDGTLVDSGEIWKELDIHYLQKNNIFIKEIPYEEMFGEAEMGDSIFEYVSFFKQKFALSKNIKEIINDFEGIASSFYKNLKINSSAIDLFNFLKEKKLNVTLGTSNSRKLVELTLQENKVLNFFDFLATGESGNLRGKPYPDIFLKITEIAKVKPENCIVVEDSSKGILAGKNANMKTISVNEKINFANHFARNFSEIKKIINDYI